MAKILLIDDESDFLELAGTMLDFNNFEVKTIEDPTKVMKTLVSEPFDLIVTDLMMPNLNGFELIDQIQNDVSLSKIPILVLTAKPLTSLERENFLKTKVEFLMKPFDPMVLIDRIKAMTTR